MRIVRDAPVAKVATVRGWRARGAAGSVLLLIAGLSCGFDTTHCPPLEPFGVYITVVDARSGLSVPSVGTKGILIEGEFREVMFVLDSPTILFSPSRAGIYEVEITSEGYRTWRTSGVVVEVDQCGQAYTVEMTAIMQPADGS